MTTNLSAFFNSEYSDQTATLPWRP